MSGAGLVRWTQIPTLVGFDPTDPVRHPGDMMSVAGAPNSLFIFYQDGANLNAVNLLNAVEVNAGFTGSSSGDGVIAIVVEDGNGDPMDGALIDVDIISAGNVTSVGISGGLGVLNSHVGAGTPSMIVHGQTNASGLLSLDFNGTASQAYRFVITARAASTLFPADAVTLTGTLPA